MNYFIFSALLFVVPLTTGSLHCQELKPRPGQYGVDDVLKMILVRADLDTVGEFSSVRVDGRVFLTSVTLTEPRYDERYVVAASDIPYELHFTRLPLLCVVSQGRIVNEPKVPVRVTYSEDGRNLNLRGGVEYRGAFSQGFRKKNLDFEFDEDVRFGQLRRDDDWVLDALFNEPLRVNSLVSRQLWLDQATPYYGDREPAARVGADVVHVEAFLNGRYQGVHMLGEQVDRKLLKLKKLKGGEIRGELFKGVLSAPGTLFSGAAPTPSSTSRSWSGYEQKYPEPRDTISWDGLAAFRSFVSESEEDAFRTGISQRINRENALDYLIFINVIGGWDNTARNVYTARYAADEPYFFVPWDLDWTFGNQPRFLDSIPTTNLHTNGLFWRLLQQDPDGFSDELCLRYETLRAGLYSADNIKARFVSALDNLRSNNALTREALRWPGTVDDSDSRIDYTYRWIDDRLAYLDGALCDFATSIEMPAESAATDFRFFPNPATEMLTVIPAVVYRGDYELYSTWGQRLSSGPVRGRTEIDVSNLASGIYFLKIGRRVRSFVVR
ncbi:CotH kinase family protein [Neolewinella antarctica]|uniref:Secretion system C-terminal sorting domain-containing protein n=1 Tax=Neolewinella antarctica TaxID=442734 RepID=A0ABX0X8M6_9BACT|nr:CotH kinase family protein [Neolewinella antarctica]NJC25571.1 hypothetical protein [Neolewinella antarctica]